LFATTRPRFQDAMLGAAAARSRALFRRERIVIYNIVFH
jgi:hypothetical protein